MIRFKRLTLQNFQSFGNQPTVIELDTGLTTLILGNNLDIGTQGDSRNAAGKSVIFAAIYWCLFNCGIDDDIKLDGLINFDNAKHTKVVLELDVNSDAVRITRTRKPNGIELLKNGVPFTLHSTGDTDKDIVVLLRMDGEAFKNTYLLDANQKPFMAMKGAQQRDFMERFLETDILTRRAEALKATRIETEMEFKLEQARIESAKTYNAQAQSQIQTLELRVTGWAASREKEKQEIRTRLEMLAAIDLAGMLNQHADKERLEQVLRDNESLLATVKQNYSEEQHAISTITALTQTLLETEEREGAWVETQAMLRQRYQTELKQYDIEALREVLAAIEAYKTFDVDLLRIKNSIDSSDRKFSQMQEKLLAAEKNLVSLASHTCPYCAQPWHSDTIQVQVNKTQQDITSYTAQMKALETEVLSHLDAESALKADKEKQTKELEGLPTARECVDQIAKAKALETALQNMEHASNPHTAQAEVLLAKLKTAGDLNDLKARSNGTAGSIRAIEHSVTTSRAALLPFAALRPKTDLVRMESEIAALNNRLIALEADAINPYIEQKQTLEQSIKSIDETQLVTLQRKQNHAQMLVKLLTDSKSFVRKNIIDNYIPFLNGKINQYLEKLGSPHVVKINADLTVELYYFEHEASYGLLSKGEKLRLNFSTSCAFRDLAATFGKTFNLILIDEYMDSGSDPEFFMRVFDMLSQSKYSIFIVSHRDELKQLASRNMTVTKKNRFSTVEID